MSNSIKPLTFIKLALCSSLLLSCSGDDGGITGIEGTGDRADDLIAARGSVTQFGSIYVNGIHFNTDNTRFLINGKDVDESAIEQGMVVYVEGKPGENESEATADLVTFDYLTQGVIEDIVNSNSNQRTIAMLGFTIVANEESMSEGSTSDKRAFDNLKIGDYISVSGFTDGNKLITATRITVEDSNNEVKDTVSLSGRISAHSGNEMIFSINDQTIDYTNANFTSNEINAIKVGVNVRVKGSITKATSQTEPSKINATKIDFIKQASIDKSRSFSTEGTITNYISKSNFVLNGMKVNASGANITGNVNTAIGNSLRITAKGTQGINGVFKADSLHVHHVSGTRISGPVTSIHPETGAVTVSGIQFDVDDYTKYEDLGSQRNRYFNLEDIELGDNLDIFSLAYGEKNIALTLRRKTQNFEHAFVDRELRIKGKPTALNLDEKQFYLMDILVDAKNIDDSIFDELDADSIIFVTGQFDTTEVNDKTFTAEQVFILRSNCTSHREVDCNNQRSMVDHKQGGGGGFPQKDWNGTTQQKDKQKDLPTSF